MLSIKLQNRVDFSSKVLTRHFLITLKIKIYSFYKKNMNKINNNKCYKSEVTQHKSFSYKDFFNKHRTIFINET